MYDLTKGGDNPALAFSRWLTSGPTSACEASNSLPCWSQRDTILAGVLADRLKVPVAAAHPIERLDVAPSAFDGLNMDEVAPLLMLPVGLALRTAA